MCSQGFGGMCECTLMCSHGVMRDVWIAMDVPWMCSQSVRRDVWIVMDMFLGVLGGMCG